MAFGRSVAVTTLLLFSPLLPLRAQAAEPAYQLAQAQPPLTPQEKARREHEQKKAQPPPEHKAPTPAPEHKAMTPPAPEHKAMTPPAPEHKAMTPPAPEHKAMTPPAPEHKAMTPPAPEHKAMTPPLPQGQPAPGQPPAKAPTAMQKGPGPLPGQQGRATPPGPRPQLPQFQLPKQTGGPAPHLDSLQKARTTHVEDGGRRTVIVEPGNRTIIRQDNRVVIRHDDGERFRLLGGGNARSEKRPDGLVETFYARPDGVRVVSVVDANGRLVRRYRRGVDGVEINIIDNRRFFGTGVAIGVGAVALGVLLTLPAPVITLPPERYIVAYDRASDDDLFDALSAEPIEHLDRAYSLEEIRENYALRQRLRRIDLDTITFEFGSWSVPEMEYPKLERIAHAMLRLLDRNPDEVFLVAAYTDAVGSDVDNLSLSDRRAESVAEILTVNFGVPPENLVTQGYGSQFLKIDTPAPEPRNRRVEIQRITPLMAER
jgi:outer membrane protein OmpA-like peptidoglycan-associated protein